MPEEEWRWITDDEWYARLDPDTRAQADQLLAVLKRYGAADPLGWVRSEIGENIPQLARFLILRQIRAVMDRQPFGDLDVARQSAAAISRTLDLAAIAQQGQSAFQRLVDSGAAVEDILRVARAVNVQAVLDLINVLDEGDADSPEDGALGWALVETRDYKSTGRYINALHENIISLFEGDDQLQ